MVNLVNQGAHDSKGDPHMIRTLAEGIRDRGSEGKKGLGLQRGKGEVGKAKGRRRLG